MQSIRTNYAVNCLHKVCLMQRFDNWNYVREIALLKPQQNRITVVINCCYLKYMWSVPPLQNNGRCILYIHVQEIFFNDLAVIIAKDNVLMESETKPTVSRGAK